MRMAIVFLAGVIIGGAIAEIAVMVGAGLL
jgi:hypothetical protein